MAPGLPANSHPYQTPGTYTIELFAWDDDMSQPTTPTTPPITVTVAAVAPTILAPPAVNEGETFNITLAADASIDYWTIQWGDGATDTIYAYSATTTATHTYADDNPIGQSDDFQITATAHRNGQAYAAEAKTVTVQNLSPVLTQTVSLNRTELPLGFGTVALSGKLTDAGVADSHQLTIDWGDGTTTIHQVERDLEFSFGHEYAAEDGFDEYSVSAFLSDDDGGVVVALNQVKVKKNKAPELDLVPTTDRTSSNQPEEHDLFLAIGYDRLHNGTTFQKRLATFRAFDPEFDSLTWSIVSGNTDDLFEIVAGPGTTTAYLQLKRSLSQAESNYYSLRIRVTDQPGADAGLHCDEGSVAISIRDVSVGVSGDMQAIEGQPDQITLYFERVVKNDDPALRDGELEVQFSVAWGDGPGKLSLNDFDEASQAKLTAGKATIAAGNRYVAVTLNARSNDVALEGLESARLSVSLTSDYGIVGGGVLSVVEGAADEGILALPFAQLQVLDGVTLFGKKHPGAPDDAHVVSTNDIRQNGLPNCYFWATVMALVEKQPGFIESIIRRDPESESPTDFQVLLYNSEGVRTWIDVALDLRRGFAGADLSGDVDAEGNVEVWTVLLEDAFLATAGRTFIAQGGSDPRVAWQVLTGLTATQTNVASWTTAQVLDQIQQDQSNGKVVLLGTEGSATSLNSHHMYLAGAVGRESPDRYMILYNPYGDEAKVIFSEAIGGLLLQNDVQTLYSFHPPPL